MNDALRLHRLIVSTSEMNPIREALCSDNSTVLLERMFGADGMGVGLSSQFVPHVAEVMRRIEVAAGEENERLWFVKLIALVHEMPPAELPATLDAAGMRDATAVVLPIIKAFGEVWRIKDQASLENYISVHRAYLDPLLLFEIAHEGTATEAMHAVARMAGIEERLVKWSTRIATFHPTDFDVV